MKLKTTFTELNTWFCVHLLIYYYAPLCMYHGLKWSVVWHHVLPLKHSFNSTGTYIFTMQAMVNINKYVTVSGLSIKVSGRRHWVHESYWKSKYCFWKFVKHDHNVALSLGVAMGIGVPVDLGPFSMGYCSTWIKTGIFSTYFQKKCILKISILILFHIRHKLFLNS